VIEPHKQLVFQPGGYHLMVFKPAEKVKKGLQFEFQLNFKKHPNVVAKGRVITVLEQQQQKQHSHH
jgi:copper(I)-binding protein